MMTELENFGRFLVAAAKGWEEPEYWRGYAKPGGQRDDFLFRKFVWTPDDWVNYAGHTIEVYAREIYDRRNKIPKIKTTFVVVIGGADDATANCFFDTPEEALALFNTVQDGITFEKAREIGFQF